MEMTTSMDDIWYGQSPVNIDFEVSPNQADAWDDCREKSKTVHCDIPRKSQSRSSIENWLDHSDHEENSWRTTPKINLNEVKTQRLLVYFDTRMKMYELMKEKFQIW